ncbi:sensor histidine kinase [Streptomyces sp. NBC_01716]|uniref:sensor histidine kinase n=1 Tax=Streptomyces sp. NBC_01716 TaxID=2975917 RepID=UPI002E367A62|nr:histidine kinase [Streptomyces sp. NBC_01716]
MESRVEQADAARIARTLRRRLTAGVPWSTGRIVGETVLAIALAGFAGLVDGVAAGFGGRTLAVTAGVALLSVARRALPATVLVLSAALAGELIAATPLLVYASWSAGSRITKPWRVAAAYGAALALNTARAVHDDISTGSGLPVTSGLGAGAFLILSIVPGLAARYRAQRRALLEALRRNNDHLVREQTVVAREARLLERNRIAHDMHDSLGHQLALISVHAGALQVDPELTDRQREGVRILREASVTAMGELREAVGILHGAATDGNGGEGGGDGGGHPVPRTVASIDGLVASSRAAGATVELHRSGVHRPLAPAADHEAYRIAQEGLTNAHKHAPGAPIRLSLRYEPDSLVVEVANGPVPGGGSEVPAAISGQQGLKGLRKRVALVGGMVHTGPTADGGFRIAGMLPYGGGAAGSGGEAGDGVYGGDGATSGGRANDFVGQIPPGAVDHGGTVTNRSEPQTEFTTIMSTRKNVAIGCAGTAVVLIAGIIALGVWGVGALKSEFEKAEISPSVYESVKVGDPEADVQGKLPDEDSALTSDLKDQGPALPEGASCRHFVSAADNLDTTTVFRFCFRDGKLVAKETYNAV